MINNDINNNRQVIDHQYFQLKCVDREIKFHERIEKVFKYILKSSYLKVVPLQWNVCKEEKI